MAARGRCHIHVVFLNTAQILKTLRLKRPDKNLLIKSMCFGPHEDKKLICVRAVHTEVQNA